MSEAAIRSAQMSWRAGWAAQALLSAAVLLGCGAGPSPTPRDARVAPSEKPVTPDRAAHSETPAQAGDEAPGHTERWIQERLALVSKLRGLEAKHPVRGEELAGGEMVELVRDSIEREVPAEVITATNAFLYLAGLVDEAFDYKTSLLEVMGSDLAGFYDPEHKTMYLRRGLGQEERSATLAHELVHALQDQHYDLASLDRWEPDSSDPRSALHALAEGDATSAMLDGMVLGTGRTALDLPQEALSMRVGALASDSKVEGIVLRAVVAPYVDGLRFVHALRRAGGWQRVDEVWRSPPKSTEQLLHVEKYLAGEAPEPVDLPPGPPGAGMQRIYQDIEGEQTLRILFREWFEPGEADRYASDWAGDRLAVFARGETKAFAWAIRYDTDSAAKRAMQGMAGWLTRARSVRVRGQNGSLAAPLCGDDPQRGPLAMARRGRDIAVVGGPTQLGSGCPGARGWLSSLLRPGSN